MKKAIIIFLDEDNNIVVSKKEGDSVSDAFLIKKGTFYVYDTFKEIFDDKDLKKLRDLLHV